MTMKHLMSTSPMLSWVCGRMMFVTISPTALCADLTAVLSTPRILALRRAPTAEHTSATSIALTATLPVPRRMAPVRRMRLTAASFTGCGMMRSCGDLCAFEMDVTATPGQHVGGVPTRAKVIFFLARGPRVAVTNRTVTGVEAEITQESMGLVCRITQIQAAGVFVVSHAPGPLVLIASSPRAQRAREAR